MFSKYRFHDGRIGLQNIDSSYFQQPHKGPYLIKHSNGLGGIPLELILAV